MMHILLGVLLLAVGLLACALQRLYSSVPAHELKRVASRGDALAQALHRASAYGGSLRLFLWTVAATATAGGAVLLAAGTPGLVGFAALALVLAAALVLLPSLRLTARTAQLAAWLAGPVAKAVGWLHPALDRLSGAMAVRHVPSHSGLYEKDDLTALLHQQKDQADNRISPQEIELANRALHFDDTRAGEITVKTGDLQLVKADDTVGPIVLEELHQSGQANFVVVDKDEQPQGTLRLQDAVKAKQGGQVAALTHPDLCYVHEDYSLRQVLAALMRSGQQLAIVVNSFDEMVGAVTLQDVTQRLLGGQQPDVLYDDRAVVAAYKPDTPQEPAAEAPQESSETPLADEVASSEAPEVVE